MHLKNAAAFKFQKKETFYDSFDAIRLTEQKQRKIERDHFKQQKDATEVAEGEREMKNSFETIKIISWLFFNRISSNNKWQV